LGILEGVKIMDIVEMVNRYGFPVIAAAGMGYFIYFVWKWVTTEIKPVIGQANGTLIALIDRIRMLDNDLIRLNQKIETVMELRGKTIEYERIIAEKEINKTIEPPRPTKTLPHRKFTKEEINDAAGDD
jgi:hypothetical protein